MARCAKCSADTEHTIAVELEIRDTYYTSPPVFVRIPLCHKCSVVTDEEIDDMVYITYYTRGDL